MSELLEAITIIFLSGAAITALLGLLLALGNFVNRISKGKIKNKFVSLFINK